MSKKNVKKQSTKQTPQFKKHGKNFQSKQKAKGTVTEVLVPKVVPVPYDAQKAVQDIIAKYQNKK